MEKKEEPSSSSTKQVRREDKATVEVVDEQQSTSVDPWQPFPSNTLSDIRILIPLDLGNMIDLKAWVLQAPTDEDATESPSFKIKATTEVVKIRTDAGAIVKEPSLCLTIFKSTVPVFVPSYCQITVVGNDCSLFVGPHGQIILQQPPPNTDGIADVARDWSLNLPPAQWPTVKTLPEEDLKEKTILIVEAVPNQMRLLHVFVMKGTTIYAAGNNKVTVKGVNCRIACHESCIR